MRPKKNIYPREKRKYIKKTSFMIRPKTNKIKSDSEEGLGSKISNVDNVVGPVSGLSNTSSKAESGSGNREEE